MNSPLLVVKDLVKNYRNKRALAGVSLTVAPGEVVCIVGPNGAGKTTLVECVQGIRTPSQGVVEILGHRASEGPWLYHSLFGSQLQESSLPARIRVREALELFAAFHADPADIEEMLQRMGLIDQRNEFFGRISTGQKRRLQLALALIGRPPLVLLDEPTTGLDPHARLALWGMLRESTAGGSAIAFTTHDMAEAEQHSDRVYLLDHGTVIAEGRPDDLLREAGIASRVCAPAWDGIATWLRTVPGYADARVIEGNVYGFGDAEYAHRLLARLQRARADVDGPDSDGLPPELAGRVLDRITVGPARLEDFYLISTGSVYARAA